MSPKQLETICELLSGGESVRDACKAAGIHHSTFYNTLNKGDEISTRIARAREAQQDYEADQCVTMADNATEADWQVVKLRIWARQWRASKLAPKKYGDKITQEHVGKDGGAIEVKWED